VDFPSALRSSGETPDDPEGFETRPEPQFGLLEPDSSPRNLQYFGPVYEDNINNKADGAGYG
jgi:hypothetical protein